jgi:hypothetical protein
MIRLMKYLQTRPEHLKTHGTVEAFRESKFTFNGCNSSNSLMRFIEFYSELVACPDSCFAGFLYSL